MKKTNPETSFNSKRLTEASLTVEAPLSVNRQTNESITTETTGTINTDTRELYLLEEIERDPDVTQASLAAHLGVAVGTVNWLLKRFIDKGYVKVKRLQRRKLRYIITPEGISFRARLTLNYIDTSLRLYRRVREHVRQLLRDVKNVGYSQVIIQGDGDLADICKLTCLEFNLTPLMLNQEPVSMNASKTELVDQLPVLEIRGTRVTLHMEPAKE